MGDSSWDGWPEVIRTLNIGPVHVGQHAPGEPWECADDCPHPDHPAASPAPTTGDPREKHA